MKTFAVSDRNRVRRTPNRASYDHDAIHSILDANFLCHVGFSLNGQPFIIPTSYARDGDTLILHGSSASRLLGNLSEGADACVSVTMVDGLVLARSSFHHSINYRSAILFGKAELISDPDEKLDALELFMEHLTPGRWSEARKPTPNELKATAVIRFRIDEASAKTRTGGPVDAPEDHELEVWAGVIPMAVSTAEPLGASDLRNDTALSSAARKTAERWAKRT